MGGGGGRSFASLIMGDAAEDREGEKVKEDLHFTDPEPSIPVRVPKPRNTAVRLSAVILLRRVPTPTPTATVVLVVGALLSIELLLEFETTMRMLSFEMLP